MTKLRELLFGEYDDINRALKNPGRVKRLILVFLQSDENINDYAEDFLKFERLSKLSIQTSANHVSYLPKQIGRLKNLVELSVLNVQFHEFPLWITELKKLKRLHLRGFNFLELNVGVKKLDNLEVLSLDNCDFTVLPTGLKMIKNLKVLNCNADWQLKIQYELLPEKLEVLHVFRQNIIEEELLSLRSNRPELKLYFVDDGIR